MKAGGLARAIVLNMYAVPSDIRDDDTINRGRCARRVINGTTLTDNRRNL